MASQCYSASVERCSAVTVAPSTPSFWEYLIGKNRAKLNSVKVNLSAIRPYVVKPQYADSGVFTNWLSSNSLASITYTNDQEWSVAMGLSTNFLTTTATPWFSLQSLTNDGWHGAWRMLTNSVWFLKSLDRPPIGTAFYFYGRSYTDWEEAYSNITISSTNYLYFRGEGARMDFLYDRFSGSREIYIQQGLGWSNTFSSACTSIAYSADFYYKGSEYEGRTFNNLGSPVSTNFNCVAHTNEAINGSVIYVFSQNTIYPTFFDPGEWTDGDFHNYAWEYYQPLVGGGSDKGFAIMKFNGTNGFKYK